MCHFFIQIKTDGFRIFVMDLDRNWWTIIIDTDLVELRAIAVDPRNKEKRLYFTDKHGIYRAGLDGAGRETVIMVRDNVTAIRALSIGRYTQANVKFLISKLNSVRIKLIYMILKGLICSCK